MILKNVVVALEYLHVSGEKTTSSSWYWVSLVRIGAVIGVNYNWGRKITSDVRYVRQREKRFDMYDMHLVVRSATHKF